PDATLPMQLATRPGMMMSPAFMEDPNVDTQAVGTGPFMLVDFRPDDRGVYEPNPDHWNPDYARLATLEIHNLPDQITRLNALRSGQIDCCPIGVDQIGEMEGNGAFNTEIFETIETYHFQPDRTKAEFGNALVRQAMSHAIDREAIVAGVMSGHATAATQWVAPNTAYYVDDLGDSTVYDVERGRELMAEAGLEDGFSFTAGVSVQPIFVQLAEVLQSMFAEIGITMNVEQSSNLADTFFVQNGVDGIVSPYPGRIDPTETTQVYFNDESFSNPGRQIDPEVTEAYDAAMIPSDDREAAIEELVRAIDTSMPNIPILYPSLGLSATPNVQGLTWYRSGHIEFAGVTIES
ncbi:MAG: ABC transporter substrate-binding protein, partial [Desertimonas sp.]